MARMQIIVDRDLERLAKGLNVSSSKVRTSVSRALNRAASQARTGVDKGVRERIGVKKRDVFKNVTVRRASTRRLESIVKIRGRAIPLGAFKARQTKRGATAKINKTGGRTLYRGTFTATMRSGHLGVYKRIGKTRLPLKELYGPSIPTVVEQEPDLAVKVEHDAAVNLERALTAQMELMLKKTGRA